MQALSFKKSKVFSHCFVISTVFFLFFFTALPSAFADDGSSIDTLRQMGRTFAEIAEKASPAVVGIKVEKTIERYYSPRGEDQLHRFFDPFEDDIFDYFFRRQRQQRPRRRPQSKPRQVAEASGFIISPDGYILTNNHLVGEADKVIVQLADKRELEAKIIGSDPDSDVAVIKIEADNLAFLELADSDVIEVGEWVLAIGNPFRLSHTVTAGIVSAKGRSGLGLTALENFIQTDAAINFGNSGGPLLNLDGKVVGINTAIIGASGNLGIGFAIPSNMAKSVYEQLVESGTVVRGILGVYIKEVNGELAKSLGLDEETKGVAITKVTEDSAAEKAGMKRYDVIVEFEGEKVEKANEFRNRIAMQKPGTRVKLVVMRDGKPKTLFVKLGEKASSKRAGLESSERMEQLGFAVENLSDELAKRFGYEGLSGVLVTRVEPGSQAARRGITAGTLILEVNRRPVANTKEFDKAIKQSRKEGTALLLVTDGRYEAFVVLKLSKK